MKNTILLALLLCLMSFFGYSQQVDEEIFGQAPISKELPAHIQLNNNRGGADATAVWAHAMYIPSQGYTYGMYYVVYQDGTVSQVEMYNDWYYSSAEYYSGEVITEGYPVWAYAEDLEIGFMCLGYEDGSFLQNQTNPISLSMNDITYDYHNSRMLGVKYGRIYEVNISAEGDLGDIVRDADGNDWLYAYDETDEDGNPLYLLEDGSYPIRPIAIACDLDGTVYFITTSADGTATSYLYKFEKEDVSLDNPIPVGALNWPARGIQTMAFNHNTRQLYWFACDKDGNSQLKELDKTSGTIIWEGEMLNTQIGGLVFEFEYVQHSAACINEEGSLFLDNGETANEYYPGEKVNVAVTSESCRLLENMIVTNAENDEVLFSFLREDIVDGVITFEMPICDINIDATWIDNESVVNLTWTPTSLPENGLSVDDAAVSCGEVATVTYVRPQGYFLKSITVTDADGNNIEISINAEDSQILFEMPGGEVTVNAVYKKFKFHQLDDICQNQTLSNLPIEQHTSQMHEHIFYFTPVIDGVEGETVQFGPTGQYGSGACHQIDEEMSNYVFTIAGTWNYMSEFIDRRFGPFYTNTKSFQVFATPESIAIEGNANICEDGNLALNVVPTPASTSLNGAFQWFRDGTLVATTTEPQLEIDPVSATNAGDYSATYTIGDGLCQFETTPITVNVSTLPEITWVQPDISVNYGAGDIPLEVDVNGVVNPEGGMFSYMDLLSGEWVEITGNTFNPTVAGEYQLVYNYNDENGCSNVSEIRNVIVGVSVQLINTEGGTVQLSGSEVVFMPDDIVYVSMEANDCMHLATVEVFQTSDHIVTLPFVFDNDSEGHFTMPEYNVDVVATWANNEYGITYNWTPTGVENLGISGPETGQCGSEVTINYNIVDGYALTSLIVQSANDNIAVVPLSPNQEGKRQFVMPNGPVNVYATFDPIEWNFTLYYMLEGTTTQVATPYTAIYHYNDPINVASPTVAGFVPLTDPYIGVMPNNHFSDTVYYTGDMFEVIFCNDFDTIPYVISYGTNHTDNFFQAMSNVTVNVEYETGWSSNVNIENLNSGEVLYNVGNNSITFQMPASDVLVCIDITSKAFLDTNSNDLNVSLYPNPTSNEVKILCEEVKIDRVTVYDILGQIVFDNEVNGNEAVLHLNASVGMYLVRITTAQGYFMKKLMVE